MIKTRGILPPEEIGYQMHDDQDREPPPTMARKMGPGKRFEARLKKICMKVLVAAGESRWAAAVGGQAPGR